MLGFAGLTGVLTDHLQVSVETPQNHFRTGGLSRGGNQEVDCWAAMTPVRRARKLALDFQRSLHARVRQGKPVKRSKQPVEALLVLSPCLGAVHDLENDWNTGDDLTGLIAIRQLFPYVRALGLLRPSPDRGVGEVAGHASGAGSTLLFEL